MQRLIHDSQFYYFLINVSINVLQISWQLSGYFLRWLWILMLFHIYIYIKLYNLFLNSHAQNKNCCT